MLQRKCVSPLLYVFLCILGLFCIILTQTKASRHGELSVTLQAICASFTVSALWEREIYEGLEIVKFIQIALSLLSITKKCFMFLKDVNCGHNTWTNKLGQ